MPFFCYVFRFIRVFTNLSEVHSHESTICGSENDSGRAKLFLPYLSFPPSDLLSSRMENMDLRDIVDCGMAKDLCKNVEQVTFIRIGQN